MTKRLIFVILILFSTYVFSANILYIGPIASPSHHIWNRALAFDLLEKGHNITMLGHDPEKDPLPKNFTLILLEGAYKEPSLSIDIQGLTNQTPLRHIVEMYQWAISLCEHDIRTKGFQKLLDYPQHFFDLIIFDVTLGQCLYPLIERFGDPPVLAVTPFLLPPVLSKSFGNNLYTSYMPYYSTTFTNKMDFKERIFNFVFTHSEQLYRKYVYLVQATEIANRAFGANIRSLEETERRISMLLCNIDFVVDYPITLPPNIIPVGGLQIKPPQILPLDLKKIVDSAKHGIVLFSLGTNLQSNKLDLKMRQAFLNAFERIPQTVLWKFEDESVKDLPKNVIVRKWLPQNDILGHKNVKLFISHGGGLSTQEAMYHGVPVIGIPFFSDQTANVAKMVQKGLATYVDFKNLTSAVMYEKLKEMLDNPKYQNNVDKVSKYYRDQPQTGLERAVFWTEYILRHGTVEHLVPTARDMSSYQINNLDVLGILFILSISLVYLLVVLIMKTCRLISVYKNQTKIKTS